MATSSAIVQRLWNYCNVWTDKLWIYDLRTNQNCTLKQNPLTRASLDEFVACFRPAHRHERAATWSPATALEQFAAIKADLETSD